MGQSVSEKEVIKALSVLPGWVDVCIVGETVLGRDLTKREAWEVGSRMASRWKERTGLSHPPFALIQKRFGNGTHLKAVYPPSWVEEISLMVKVIASRRSVANGFQEHPMDGECSPLEGTLLLDLFGPGQEM